MVRIRGLQPCDRSSILRGPTNFYHDESSRTHVRNDVDAEGPLCGLIPVSCRFLAARVSVECGYSDALILLAVGTANGV